MLWFTQRPLLSALGLVFLVGFRVLRALGLGFLVGFRVVLWFS